MGGGGGGGELIWKQVIKKKQKARFPVVSFLSLSFYQLQQFLAVYFLADASILQQTKFKCFNVILILLLIILKKKLRFDVFAIKFKNYLFCYLKYFANLF